MRNHIHALLAAVAVTALAGVAYADSPHYVSLGPAAVGGDDKLDYAFPFKEAGLGDLGTQATYTLTLSSMSVTYQCFNHGGNAPQGQPFTVGTTNVTDQQSFPVNSRNGSVTGTMTVQEPEVPSGSKCTGNGVFCAVGYSYSTGTLTDPFGNTATTGALDSGPDYLNCKIDQP